MSSQVSVTRLLEAVAELGTASRSLAAWQLCVDERAVTAAWSDALAGGLLESAGFAHREAHWRLSAAGAQHVSRPGP